MSVQKSITVISAIVETLCVSTLVYGWSSMDYILTKEGYFDSGCNNSKSGFHNASSDIVICHSQQYNLELIYTLSAFISANCALIGGAIMDRFGTRVLRDLGTVLFMASCFAIAFSTPQTSWILYPAMIILACSGGCFFITNLQTANLFPKFRGTIVNVVNGAATGGLVVFTLAKQAYEHGISLKAIFLFLAFLGILVLLRTYFLMPRIILPYDVPSDFHYGINEYCSKHTDNSEILPLLMEEQSTSEDIETSNKVSFRSSVSSSLFILGAFALAIQWFRLSYYLEALDAYLDYLLPHNSALVSYSLSVFGYIQLTAFIFAPLNGIIYDSVYYYFDKHTLNSTQTKLKSLIVVCLICISTTITYSIFTLIDVINLQYVSYVLVLMSNTFQSANFTLLAIQCFPMEHFGKLFGLAMFVSSVFMTLQFPLYYVALHYFNGNFFVSNLVALLLVIAALTHPFNLYRKSKQQDINIESCK